MMEREVDFSGRRLIAFLRDADRPCIIVNHQMEVVFANKTASTQIGVPLDQLNRLKFSQHSETTNASNQQNVDDAFVPELQAWCDVTKVLQDSSSELIAAANKQSEYQYWLAISLQDSRSRRLAFFFGVRESESASHDRETNNAWKADQAILDYRRTLTSQQYTLSKLLPLLGPHSATKLAMRQTQLAIDSHASVLITGPKGSGKRTLANAILFARNRATQEQEPPTVISCQLVDKNLLREIAELIGERLRSAKANKSPAPAILLDRIDLLSDPCREPMLELIKQVGNASIAATSLGHEFNGEVQTEQRDLFHALGILEIKLCPMKERARDVPVVVQQLLHQLAAKEKTATTAAISDEARQMMVDYCWPGNLSELVAAVQHAASQNSGSEVLADHLPISIRTYPASLSEAALEPVDLEKILAQTERTIIQRALQHFPRNRAAAARHLGISRTKLFRKVQQLGIDIGDETELLEQAPTNSESGGSPARKPKNLSTEQIVDLAIEEGDELPVFREIPDED